LNTKKISHTNFKQFEYKSNTLLKIPWNQTSVWFTSRTFTVYSARSAEFDYKCFTITSLPRTFTHTEPPQETLQDEQWNIIQTK